MAREFSNRVNNMNEYQLSIVAPSPYDVRDHVVSIPTSILPTYVDLIPAINEVENQERTSSCTAQAGASALEIAYSRAGSPVDLSRLYLYWYIRDLGGFKGDKGPICTSDRKLDH